MTTSERYARQLVLPGFGRAAQERLAAARVLVLGAGGLGSAVIPALAAVGVGTIGIVDDDAVELSNLPRQLTHGVADVGAAKTASAAASVAALNPDTVVHEHALRFTTQDAAALVSAYDLVVDGTDNFPTRYLADDAARLAGLPLVWGSVQQYAGQVSVAWHARGPVYRDLFPQPPAPGEVLSCEQGGVFPATVHVVGALMAAEALKVLTGVGEPLVGRVVLYDARDGAFRELAFERDPDGVDVTGFIDYDAFCGSTGPADAPAGAEIAHEHAHASDELTPHELEARMPRVAVLDVREPWELEIARMDGTIDIPLGDLADRLAELPRDRPIVAMCHHGVRSARALDILRSAGFADAQHLAGGIDAWAREVDPAVGRY